MKQRLITYGAAGLLAFGAAATGLFSALPAAAAAPALCEKYGSTPVSGGRYIVQNNNWGDDTSQCFNVHESGAGFTITKGSHNKPANGAPGSYPSIYFGCHYTNCTSGSGLPLKASTPAFASISTSVSMTFPSTGVWDAAYDIWFDPTPRTDGQNTGAEMMIWLNKKGPIQPVGSKVGTATINGAKWNVWEGNIGWNVISYVRESATTSLKFPVNDFFSDAVNRGYAQRSWYLTSIQAGFEPWVGQAGLAVNSFSVTGGGNGGAPGAKATPAPPPAKAPAAPPPPATPVPPVTPVPQAPPVPQATPALPATPVPPVGGDGAGCSAANQVAGVWPGGFQSDVAVSNTGTAALNGWTLTLTVPSGVTVTQAWNGSFTQSGSTVVIRNMPYNANLAPKAATNVGFLANTATGQTGAPDPVHATCTSP